MRRFLQAAAVAAMFLPSLGGRATAQTTVGSVTPASPDYTDIGPLGKDSELGGIPTAFAQTFVAPDGAPYLQSFNFFFTNFFSGSALNLTASVYAFDTDHLSGSALFTSAVSGTDSYNDEALSFGTDAPLNRLLTPGTVYALVLSAAEGYDTTPDGSSVLLGASSDDSYAGGSLYVSFATNAADLQTDGAFTPADAPDAAFSATFTDAPVTATPEPGTLMLIATGLVGVGGIVRRRRASAV